jgi:redox-sensitive bicupin YhaK (pirin superfamily)
MEGAGVPITRVLPSREAPYRLVDPWLLLDEFELESFGSGESFPPHPHRGFEIVTYTIAGQTGHSDSEGNAGTVGSGGLHRITAGRGIWHGEGGGGEAGPVHGLQLWINLPRALKGIDPGYQAVQADQIPEKEIDDARVRVLVGEGSPTQLQTPAVYWDVTLPAGGTTELPVPAGFQGFAYLLGGAGSFGGNALAAHQRQVVVLGSAQGDGDTPFPVTAGPEGAWFVLAAARPIREPVYFNGPYVD